MGELLKRDVCGYWLLTVTGVPKDPELEPHFKLAKRNGSFARESRLILKTS